MSVQSIAVPDSRGPVRKQISSGALITLAPLIAVVLRYLLAALDAHEVVNLLSALSLRGTPWPLY